ncbi:MAG: tetratricopeptide repeat protein [Bacteroidota bacterium]
MKYFLLLLISIGVQAQDFTKKADTAFDKENYNQALELYQKALRQSPNDLHINEQIGRVYAHQEKWKKSADVFKELVKQQPQNAEYHFMYGGGLGLYAKSINKVQALLYLDDIKTHLKKAAELDPKHIETRWALVQLYTELPTMVGGSQEVAQKYANELTQISPVDGALAKGFLAKEAENYTVAEKHLKKAVEIGQSKTTYQKLIEVLKIQNKNNAVFETLKQAFANTHSPDFLIELAKWSQKNQFQQQQAITFIARQIEENKIQSSDLAEIYFQKAKLHQDLQQNQLAKTCVDKSLQLNAKHKKALQLQEKL